MKKMKKVLAGLLVATMVMSMTVTAWADNVSFDKNGAQITQPTPSDENPNPQYRDVTSVDLSKCYKITNAGTTNPAENFEFTISREAISDSQYTKDNMPMPTFTQGEEDIVAEIPFNAGEATVNGDTNTIKLYLPTYDKVGIFTYKIVETTNSIAGVAYDSKPMYLKVTVVEQDGLIRVAALHYETVSGDKTEYFENIYSAGDLKISKTVDGIMGDKTKYFKFTVTLTGVEGKTYADSYEVSGGSHGNNPTTIEVGIPTEFYLKDADTITIKNLPYDVKYDVVEDAEDYTSTVTYSDQQKVIDSAEDTVSVLNVKDGTVDTGIILDSAPYILLLALAAMGVFAVVNKKREEEF